MNEYFIIVIVSAAVCGGLACNLGIKKGYSGPPWFFCGFFFGPLGLIAAAGLPINKERGLPKFPPPDVDDE